MAKEQICCSREDLFAAIKNELNLQQKIDEHERCLDGLLILLARRNEEYTQVKNGFDDESSSMMGFVWEEATRLVKDYKKMKEDFEEMRKLRDYYWEELSKQTVKNNLK